MSAYKKGSADADSRLLAAHFEDNQGVPVSRDQIAAMVDTQLDPLKRVRRNGGARDHLDPKGIAILWGRGDRHAIAHLGLPAIGAKEFIAYTPKDQSELDLLQASGHGKLQSPGFS